VEGFDSADLWSEKIKLASGKIDAFEVALLALFVIFARLSLLIIVNRFHILFCLYFFGSC